MNIMRRTHGPGQWKVDAVDRERRLATRRSLMARLDLEGAVAEHPLPFRRIFLEYVGRGLAVTGEVFLNNEGIDEIVGTRGIEGLTFDRCAFIGCNFEQVAGKARFLRCDFTGCSFARGSAVNAAGDQVFSRCDFEGCDMTSFTFTGMANESGYMTRCNIIGSSFADCRMAGLGTLKATRLSGRGNVFSGAHYWDRHDHSHVAALLERAAVESGIAYDAHELRAALAFIEDSAEVGGYCWDGLVNIIGRWPIGGFLAHLAITPPVTEAIGRLPRMADILDLAQAWAAQQGIA